MTKAIAIIPARGNSKRFERKNIALLMGKPLACFTLDEVIKSGCFTQIILSSESQDVLNIIKSYDEEKYKNVYFHLRSKNLAEDEVTVNMVCRKIIEGLDTDDCDIVVTLLPTAPFRKAIDIKQGISLLSPDIDSVISLVQYEYPCSLAVMLDTDNAVHHLFEPSPLKEGKTRTQDQVVAYHPNGGFYISWKRSLMSNNSFWSGRVRGYPMSKISSVDITYEFDLEYAEFLLKNGKVSING